MQNHNFKKQIQQFIFGSTFMLLCLAGMTLGQSFDKEYMAKVEKYQQMQKYIASLEAEDEESKDDEDSLVALNAK